MLRLLQRELLQLFVYHEEREETAASSEQPKVTRRCPREMSALAKFAVTALAVAAMHLQACEGNFYDGDDSQVVQLTEETLTSEVLSSQHMYFVEFYA